MTHDLPRHLQQIVDDICGDGCSRVNKVIKILQQDEVIEIMASLDIDERMLVLRELQDIMQVYNKRSS